MMQQITLSIIISDASFLAAHSSVKLRTGISVFDSAYVDLWCYQIANMMATIFPSFGVPCLWEYRMADGGARLIAGLAVSRRLAWNKQSIDPMSIQLRACFSSK